MRYGAKSPTKRIIIIAVSCLAAAALVIAGIAVFMNTKRANTTVDVQPVSYVSTTYWGDQSSTYGTATSDFVQELYPDTTKSISEIFVKEGQSVKIGDTLLQYDTTKLELTVEGKALELEKKNYELQQANKDLTRLQNTAPYVEPPIPDPEPVPTPTPTPESKATLYSEIDEHSKPFKGTGTTEDPYVFLCTEDCVLTKEFLMRLLGLSPLTPTPSPSASPSAAPTAEPGPTDPPESSESPTPTEEPTATPEATATPAPTVTPAPTATPEPVATPEPESGTDPVVSGMVWFQNLTTGETPAADASPNPDAPEEVFELPNGPFAARFEVHEEDNENLPMVKGWAMDGHLISAGFLFDAIDTPEDNIEMLGIDPDDPWVAPIDPEGMYTQEQLNQMIQEKKQEIRDLEIAVKQAKIDLSKADLELKNATVTATVNGTVKTLTDLDTALASSTPFLVVSGGDGFYVTGTLNESLLGRVNVGDMISVSAWEIGASFDAEIVKISDFPSENSYYDGTSNPNTSAYAFTAFIPEAGDLKNGMMLDIILQAGSGDEAPSDAIYLSKAYIRSDDGGRYILKVGEDKRVHKTYIQTGKTVYNEYLEIKGDALTMDDYIAFPYGTQAIDGAKANLPEDADLDEGVVTTE